MKKNLLFYLLFLLLGTSLPGYLFADDQVHFGTIFVEDIDYENADENQSINHLTDTSSKQQQLEILYKQEIGNPNRKLKKIDYYPRGPASTLNKPGLPSNQKKVGVITNRELPKQVVYFLELRSFEGHTSTTIRQQANPASPGIINLQPGELIKIVDTPSRYLHKLRMDRDNQGIWMNVHTREQDIQGPHIYYDWRNFETITSHDFPVEMDILVPYGKNSVPVFNTPGAWTWKDCGLTANLCLDNIDLHTKAYLFDVTIVDTRESESLNADYRLFYKVGYQVKDKDGIVQHRVGWIPSRHAKRKITQLPKSLIATRTPDSFGSYESDEERYKRLKKYYVFESNMYSDNRTLSRWINSTPGKTTEVFFQNIAVDGIAQFSTFSLEQDFFTGQKFSQQGIAAGIGIFAPIFIDLEIQGTLLYTVPLASNEDENPDFEKTPLFKGEQWLLYTTPLSVSGTPFKFGVGAYYMSMFASQRSFGFNSLVGFQMKGLFENHSFWAGFRYGPTGQDFGFKLENREIGLDFGYRLDPAKAFESWTVYGDFSDTNYISTTGSQKTNFQVISLGIRKQF